MTKPEHSAPGGLLPELLVQLNAAQQDYRFTLVPTSVTRRYRDLTRARYDLIFFESPDWGWQKSRWTSSTCISATPKFMSLVPEAAGRGQAYFDSLKGKRMALYNGYHYGFAGFNADQDYLSKTFNAVLTYSHDSNLLMLLHGRADLSVVPRSLRAYISRATRSRASGCWFPSAPIRSITTTLCYVPAPRWLRKPWISCWSACARTANWRNCCNAITCNPVRGRHPNRPALCSLDQLS